MEPPVDKYRLFEWCNTACWIALDIAWLMAMPCTAAVLGLFTVLTCVGLFATCERTVPEFLATAIVTAWVLMNVVWILADFALLEHGLAYAKALAALACGLLAASINRGAASATDFIAIADRIRRVRFSSSRK